mmetsp:Transcript_66173/g.186335  ORF Transcript_66173/g.186335 Transcript_66173/m.186335 type:complete len:126 (+) Transcript_66173:57-434(+)
MFPQKTLRIVEALHVLVLFLFGTCIPFCFKVMPTATPQEPEAFRDTCHLELGLTEANSPVARHGAGAQAISTEKFSSGPWHQDGHAKNVSCDNPAANRIMWFPFVIALIGGGVFSLEAFEAFPML